MKKNRTTIGINKDDFEKLNKIVSYYRIKKELPSLSLTQAFTYLMNDKLKEIENENRENTPTS